ncbi:putative ATP-dependent RNA helicase SoYb [Ochlerotatus camptorhynchus]|uniref:putative ATP-dependent RNA helicase SoYb n=1 Tax=Ochlerotatus camptorhynchus TaxID=644619 RepID=UPI0031CF438E
MEDDTIRITHFINPHMFWYKPVSAYVHNLDEKRFQLAIDEYCEENFRQSSADEVCESFPGETVAVLDFDRNKWCRCIVDEVIEDSSGKKRYNLWSIDDGVPIQSFSRYVNPLPEKFARQTSKVRRGAIKNILPSEYVYDNQSDRLVPKICSRWDPNAANVLQSVLRNSTSVQFRKVTRHSVHNIVVNFGDLELVTNKNNAFNAANLLKEIRKGFEVEPSDFITRLLEIQTMSVSRCLTSDEKETISRVNELKSVSMRPVKPSSQFEQNGLKVSNGIPESVRDHDYNGVEEDYDFNESASMVKPNNIPMLTRKPVPEPISEGSHSGEEQYPLMSPMNKSGMKINYELELWKQNSRPKSRTPNETLKVAIPKSDDRANGTSSGHNAKHEDSLEKPKSTVSFLAKLEMRKKQRAAAQKQTIPEQVQEKSPYGDINIIPAGYQIGNVKFENGKVIAGDKADAPDNRKSSWATSRPRNLSKEGNGPYQQQQSDEYDTDNCKVYVTKNGSRFDQVIEDEACIRSKLCHQRLLVHGNRIPKPVESLESANFCPEVHRELSMLKFRSIHRIQTYAWPHILRGNSFFCVNSATTGKTFTFLPAICSSVKKMHDEDLAVDGAGPFAIIICKSSREVQRVARYCRKMLNSAVNVSMSVVEAFGARDIPKACNLLLNGCAILVATAPGLRRVHENMPNAIVKERVQSVVIDNIDTIIERFGSELQLLCKICDKPELQMVITTTYWSPMFFGFLKRYKNMIMCIGAYLEAAIYGKSDLVLQLNSRAAKINEVVKFVQRNNYQNERTMVICSEAAEVHELVEILKSQSITHMYCNDTSTLAQMDGFKEWDNQLPGEMHVMICSDAVIPDLEISKAQHIIHFSLPSSWTMFTRRFACSFGYYRDPFHEDENELRKPASSMVVLDENNNEQLPKLVEFLKIHHHEVAEPIVKLANNIRIQQEEQKLAEGNHVDFCSQVLEFGKCRTAGCMKRHLFTTRDLSYGDVVPSSGIIKLKIHNMFSPTHYTARVLEHRSYGAKDWKAVNDAQEFFALDIAIQQHYSNEDRHHDHGTVHYNDWCVIFDEFRYWRCRIISIDQKKEISVSRKVKVKLLDVGRTIDCVSSELLHLPEEFRRLPPQAIDIRIVGVVPHDFELEWDKMVTLNIREWIHRYTSNDKFHVEGKVLLAIKDTIWVDTVRLVQHLDGIKTEIMEIHLKSEIVGKNFGVADKEPLELLSEMVENCQAFQDRANKATGQVEEALSDVEDVHIQNGNKVSNSEVFQSAPNVIEIDKSVKPKALKPIELSETDSDDCIPDENVPDVSYSEVNKPTSANEELQVVKPKVQSFNELYDEIDEESTYEVYISQYYAPDDFYVCKVDKFSFISSMICNFTEDETNLVPLEIVEVGAYCLALYDSNYQRAKVTHIEGRDIRLFFLDLGGYESYGQIDLFKLSDDLLKAAPFCAIKGEVACLKPRENEDQGWSPEIGDKIYDEVLCHYRSFNVKVIETLRNSHVESLVKCKCYRLLLFSPEQELESWIFDEIVELKLARYIEEERPFALDINFGDDDYRQMFNPNYEQESSKFEDDNEPRIVEIVEPKADQQSKPVKTSSKLTLLKKRLRRKKSITNIAYPRLKCDFRSPKTIWRQDEYLIIIRAVAPENVQYDLTVDSDSLKLCYIADDEKYLLSVVFFAAVVPELTIHEVRGLSIVVRLAKLVQTIQWPSLMKNGDKVPWLQQCIEVSNSDETDGTDGMRNTSPAVPNLESTDSLSEETDYDDQFDRFDPMADDYFMKDV